MRHRPRARRRPSARLEPATARTAAPRPRALSGPSRRAPARSPTGSSRPRRPEHAPPARAPVARCRSSARSRSPCARGPPPSSSATPSNGPWRQASQSTADGPGAAWHPAARSVNSTLYGDEHPVSSRISTHARPPHGEFSPSSASPPPPSVEGIGRDDVRSGVPPRALSPRPAMAHHGRDHTSGADMNTFMGADTEKLRAHADLLRDRARMIEDLRSRLEPIVMDEGMWKGPDADAFRARWSSEASSKFADNASVLERWGGDLDAQAEEQDTTSEPGSEGSGPGGEGGKRSVQGVGHRGDAQADGRGLVEPAASARGPVRQAPGPVQQGQEGLGHRQAVRQLLHGHEPGRESARRREGGGGVPEGDRRHHLQARQGVRRVRQGAGREARDPSGLRSEELLRGTR